MVVGGGGGHLEVVDAGGGAGVEDVLHDQEVHGAIPPRPPGAVPPRRGAQVLLRHLPATDPPASAPRTPTRSTMQPQLRPEASPDQEAQRCRQLMRAEPSGYDCRSLMSDFWIAKHVGSRNR